MPDSIKTVATDIPVEQFIDKLDQPQQSDTRLLCQIMTDITGYPPVMWGTAIIGFGSYHYHYQSGRQGEMAAAAFSPRKGKLAIYLTNDVTSTPELLGKLGPHQTGKVCLYIKKLSDIDVQILRQLIADSYKYVMSQHPAMGRA